MHTGILKFLMAIALLLCPFLCFSQSTQLADSLNGRGMEFYEGGQYRQAEFYLQEAFRIYQEQGNSEIWLAPGIDYAEILVDRSKYEQALELFNRLIRVAAAQKNIRAQARIENDLGWTYSKTGQHNIALDHLKKAILLAQEARDTLRLGYINDNIGGIYRSIGDYRTSLKYHKKALPYYQKLRKQQSIAIAFNNIGLAYKKLMLYDKALEYYKESLAIRKQLENIDLIATATGNIGALYKQLGNFDQALVYYQQSLAYAQKAGNPVKTAQTLNNIGLLYGVLGQPKQELAYYRQSLQLKEEYANAASLAVTYTNIAGSYWESGRPEEALDYYQKALTLRKQVGNPRTVAASLLDLARLEMSLKQYDTAESYITRSRAIADSALDHSLQSESAMLRGELHLARNSPANALTHFKRSLVYSDSLGKRAQIYPIQKIAYAFHQLESDSALHYGRRAIDLIEVLRTQAGAVSEMKATYFTNYVNFYMDMASWLLTYNRDIAAAYQIVELAKARVLTDELTQAAQRIDESLPEQVRIKRSQQLAKITSLHQRLEQTSSKPEQEKLRNQIRESELKYAAFENQLHQEYPQYKQLENPEPASLVQAREICDDGTAILEYAIANDQLLIFFISRNTVKAHQLPLNEASNLADQISKFRQTITSRASISSIKKLGTPLYNQLIKPFEKELAAFENIIIIPDGVLAYLPFEALSYKTNYLIESFDIKYSPSVTGLTLIQPQGRVPSGRLLAIASSSNGSAQKMPLLPSVELEINAVSKQFNSSTTLNDPQMNEESVRVAMQGDYAFVHVAAHSVIDEENSSMSGIVLNSKADTEAGLGNDGYLRSSEIYRMSMKSDMIVLSACKSAMGRLVGGEGMLGLQRAFFNAGVSTVAVSLWDVYDRPTMHFMTLFYTSLKKTGEDRRWSDSWQAMLRWVGWDSSMPFGNTARGMRDAKLAMLNHPQYRHPVYWAPFVVVGR